LSENDGKEVDRSFESSLRTKTIVRTGIPFAHFLQESTLEASVVDQYRLLYLRQFQQKLLPNVTFVRWAVSPETVLDSGVAHPDPNPNQVVEVPVWQALNIEVNRGAFDFHFWTAYDVDFSFSDGPGLQRVVIFLSLVLEFFWAVPRSKGVRKLGNREDAFAVEFGALFFCHIC
jgi:hypothetical protein